MKPTKYRYIVVSIADEWYEEKKGIVFNSYDETKKYLEKTNSKELIEKLDYLESIKEKLVYKNVAELVISHI